MDNSQSSDVFSDTSVTCNSSTEIMDTLSYDALLKRTKASLCTNAPIGKVTFPSHFTSLLEDCRLCITHSLDLVINTLLEDKIQISKLSQYMEDAINLMQLLSTVIKNAVESISMSCCSFKTFPNTTGYIIMLVFTHCRNSELVYGVHLNHVQKQLKDLFRTCHELQLTYLMVLEKHFIFDLTEEEQLDILIEALTINLKIGDIVQSLDVKTMAEQWKAYMALCEKYSSYLMDKRTYQECTQLLCSMIRSNLRSSIEIDQDEKVIVRSLKVTNFTIKILLKICSIFKHATMRDLSEIVDLLINVYVYNPAYVEFVEGKPPHLINAMTINICQPSELLLAELIMDDKFMNIILSYTLRELEDVKLLGYLFLIVSTVKMILQKKGQTPTYPKHKLLHCIFKCLPECYVWLNIGMRFKTELTKSKRTIGLFESLLIYGTSLALTMNGEEMCYLEKIMYEAILGTQCVVALFASNLWAALARINNNRQMLLSQTISLCQVYQKLEMHKSFLYSPQRYHISYLIEALFETMRVEDRVRVSKQFSPMDQRNVSLWTVLKIKNLPQDFQGNVQQEIMERYKSLSSNIQTQDSLCDLIQVMKLLSSCSFHTSDDVEDLLVQAWTRACSENYKSLTGPVHSGTIWYFEYIEGLVSWTSAVDHAFHDSSVNLIKVLHVISNAMKIGSTELNLLLINLLCRLATIPVYDENRHSVDSLLKESFRTIMQESNNIIVSKLYRIIRDNERLEQIVYSSISEDYDEIWDRYQKYKDRDSYDITRLKGDLLETSRYKYVHKCIETREVQQNSESNDAVQKTGSSNFDFADLDTLFDSAGQSEPASKKLKLDSNEAESILDRLESDASLLCSVKENMFNREHRRRIKCVCEKLNSLIND